MQDSTTLDPVFFGPLMRCLTPQVAERIVNIKLDAAVQRQADEWADRAAEGLLTAEERTAYALFIDRVDLLDTLKAIARQVMNDAIQ